MQELRGEDRSSRAWLWTSVSADAVCFHIDASRSAEAGLKLFAEARSDTVIVCDRYSAYKRLVRLLGDKMILSFCWSHVRRDFIDCAAGQKRLTQWCQGWIERIAEIFRLNDTRLTGIRLDKGCDHAGARTLRPGQSLLQAEKGRLASAPSAGLETNPQPLTVRHLPAHWCAVGEKLLD